MPPDKTELQIKSMEMRMVAVEKLMQKAPDIKGPDVGKRVEAMEKGFEQLKAVIAQLAKTVDTKKDKATVEQEITKQVQKEVHELQPRISSWTTG